jgi:hypothetical protein
VKLTTMALIAAGYVLGAKAGHERYEQISAGMEAASQRLEAFSSRTASARNESTTVAHGASQPARNAR